MIDDERGLEIAMKTKLAVAIWLAAFLLFVGIVALKYLPAPSQNCSQIDYETWRKPCVLEAIAAAEKGDVLAMVRVADVYSTVMDDTEAGRNIGRNWGVQALQTRQPIGVARAIEKCGNEVGYDSMALESAILSMKTTDKSLITEYQARLAEACRVNSIGRRGRKSG